MGNTSAFNLTGQWRLFAQHTDAGYEQIICRYLPRATSVASLGGEARLMVTDAPGEGEQGRGYSSGGGDVQRVAGHCPAGRRAGQGSSRRRSTVC